MSGLQGLLGATVQQHRSTVCASGPVSSGRSSWSRAGQLFRGVGRRLTRCTLQVQRGRDGLSFSVCVNMRFKGRMGHLPIESCIIHISTDTCTSALGVLVGSIAGLSRRRICTYHVPTSRIQHVGSIIISSGSSPASYTLNPKSPEPVNPYTQNS